MEPHGEGSSPSAPPIPVAFEGGPRLEPLSVLTPFAETTEHPLRPVAAKTSPLSRNSPLLSVAEGRLSLGDPNLVRDLLRKAEGDTYRVASWLEVMGERVTPEELQSELARCSMGGTTDDIDTAAGQLGAPEMYFCPVSYHLFRDPVLLQTGQTYERCVIQRWLNEGGSICPITGIQLPKPAMLTPNVALRHAIEEWAVHNADWMLGPNGRLLPVSEDERQSLDDLPVSTGHDADAALAIQMQEEELAQQRPRPRTRGSPRQNEMTRSQYDRIRRCVFLLFVITVLYFAMFVFTLSKGDWKFEKIDANPLIGFGAEMIRRAGGTNTDLMVDEHEWWRIATSALMTAGIVHLQWVVCCLWTCGRFLAARMSFLSLGLIFVASSICGVLLSANFSTESETTAASAGAFGLMGAVLVEILVHRKHYRHHVISIIFLGISAAVGILMGTTPFVDNWSNLGGLLGGSCLAMALRLTHKNLQRSQPCIEWMMIAFQVAWFTLVGLFIVGGFTGLFIEKDSRHDCNWCQQLTCVDVRWWKCDAAILSPQECHFDIHGDLSTIITCPTGVNHTVSVTDVSQRNLDRHCAKLCTEEESDVAGRVIQPNPVPSRVVVSSPLDPPIAVYPPTNSDDSSTLQQGNIEQSKLE